MVGRPRSIQAVRSGFAQDRLIFIVAQRHMKVEEPLRKDVFEYGTVAEVLQSMGTPEGLLRVRVAGQVRAKLLDMSLEGNYLIGDVQRMEIPSLKGVDAQELEAMRRMVVRKFEEYAV